MESFLLYRLPGHDSFVRLGLTASAGDRLMFGDAVVSPWPGHAFDAASPMEVCPRSTDMPDYRSRVGALVDTLRRRDGKAVIARQICGSFSRFEPEAMAREYFSRFGDMFCFLFYHPSAGYWMGASPELLLHTDNACQGRTLALAGTRRIGDGAGQWSRKNIEEHRFVVRGIEKSLSGIAGLDIAVGETGNFVYGAIEQLCTYVGLSAAAGLPVGRIVEAIHPTAAVCGYPRETAMTEIDSVEQWPRNCYGGLVSVPDGDGVSVYVILRCVHFDSERWAVYSGSGITGESDPADEWAETESKARPLLDILNSYS
ncbi:MAG: chorismate-binding protein [Muribaculaceae bacterium]|nr:chorismate-binding protein [Muribaculaceae bacterium]